LVSNVLVFLEQLRFLYQLAHV